MRNPAARQAIIAKLQTMPEPFDFRQVWAALPAKDRPLLGYVAHVLHALAWRGMLVRIGLRNAMNVRGARTALYRRASNVPMEVEAQLPPSDLELAWRAFRDEMNIPETPEISIHSLTTRVEAEERSPMVRGRAALP